MVNVLIQSSILVDEITGCLGNSPYYAEPCPAALTSLYVGGQHQKPETFKDIRYTFNVVSISQDSQNLQE